MIRLVPPRHVPFAASVAVLCAAYIVGAVAYENFASIGVVRNLAVDGAFLAVAAAGATFVILMGGIDLSVGSVMALTSVAVAVMIERGNIHPGAAMLLGLSFGAAFGAAQGVLIQMFRMPAFLVTLAGLFLARAGAFMISEQSLGVHHPWIAQFLNDQLTLTCAVGGVTFTIPMLVWIAAAVLLASWLMLGFTRFGRAVYAVGGDETSAMLMGLPVARVRIAVYTISGACAALAGIVFLLYQQSGDPAACRGFELDVIAAVVIGGTLLRGGVGSIAGTTVGVAILGLIQTLIAFQGDLSSWWTRIITGLLVLAFIGLQRVVEIVSTRGASAAGR